MIKRKRRGGGEVPLKSWNSRGRFFVPRSGPFSTDALKCWVIVRQPTSNVAWLWLIQSRSVYETQWYRHNTQNSPALFEQHRAPTEMHRTRPNARLRASSFFFLLYVSLWFGGYSLKKKEKKQVLLDREGRQIVCVGSTISTAPTTVSCLCCG